MGALLRLAAPQSAVVAVVAVLLAFAAGAVIGRSAWEGLGLVALLCVGAVALVNLPLAIALWMPLVFMTALPGFFGAERAALALSALGWLVLRVTSRTTSPLRNQKPLVLITVGLALWLALSSLWAADLNLVGQDLQRWYPALLMFFVIATTISAPEHLRLLAAGFVAGAVISVGIGLWDNSLTNSASHLQRATTRADRLHGAEGDPNLLAAGLIPAMTLGAALVALTRSRSWRLILVSAIVFMTVGLAKTASRGGFMAAIVTAALVLVLVSQRRRVALVLTVLVLSIGGTLVASSPAVLERIVAADLYQGSGRIELWRVAAEMSADHPLLGVGLNNFVVEASHYVRQVGALENVELIVDRPVVAHNVFLQMLTETGVVGLTLFVAAIVLCLLSAWRARNRFTAADDSRMATVASLVLAGTIGMLTASFFLSNAFDKRLWVLLALGPGLLNLVPPAGPAVRPQPLLPDDRSTAAPPTPTAT